MATGRTLKILWNILLPAFLLCPVARYAAERLPVRECACKILKNEGGFRHLLPECWYQKLSGLKVVTFKKNLRYGHELSLDPTQLSNQLEEIKEQGFGAIEIFAPAEGLAAYNGLDTKNHYRIDSELGTMEDFRRAVRLAHGKQIAVIVFINLGYFSIEAPDWLEACRDKKAGLSSQKTNWFLWSDKPDAPEPHAQEDIYVTRTDRERDKAFWGWKSSEAAGSYYWARWKAEGPEKSVIPLPQVNWADSGWRQEAERIVRFWMDTGIDGMLIDAPLCYPNQTWAHNRRHITSVIASYGNVLMDPEGGRDTAWITEAGYNTLHDYGLHYEYETYKWRHDDVFLAAIKSGNPSQIERTLRWYHDAVVAAGGVLYSGGTEYASDPTQRHLQQALQVGVGDIVVYTKRQGNPDAEEARNLHLKSRHPALHPVATRRKLSTNDDGRYYAILKTAQDGSERILAVYNFQPSPQTIRVDLSVVDTEGLVDLDTAEFRPRADVFAPFPVELPAYGYRFFQVQLAGPKGE